MTYQKLRFAFTEAKTPTPNTPKKRYKRTKEHGVKHKFSGYFGGLRSSVCQITKDQRKNSGITMKVLDV
jgi:hypothetical protein